MTHYLFVRELLMGDLGRVMIVPINLVLSGISLFFFFFYTNKGFHFFGVNHEKVVKMCCHVSIVFK